MASIFGWWERGGRILWTRGAAAARSLARSGCSLFLETVVGSFSGGGSRDAPLGDVGWVAPTSVTSRSLPERLIQTLRKGNLPFWLKKIRSSQSPKKFEHRESNVSFRRHRFRLLPLCAAAKVAEVERKRTTHFSLTSPRRLCRM